MTREELRALLKRVQEHDISVAKAEELIYLNWDTPCYILVRKKDLEGRKK